MIQFRPLRADEIECRVSTVSEKGASVLLYKTARTDMDLLDETVGPMNWQRTHQIIEGNLYCTISIWDDEKKQWVAKQDVGTESNTEKEKGQASDSFKRAGFCWGIGRELYTGPFIWIGASDCKIAEGRNGKLACYDNFKVDHITIEDGVITALRITNESKNGKVVFTFPKQKAHTKPEAQEEPQDLTQPFTITQSMYNVLCSLCKQKGKNTKEVVNSYGVEKPAEMLVTVWQKAVADLKELPDVQ